MMVAFGVIPEFCEYQGAEYDTKSWQRAADSGVRVQVRMVGQLSLKASHLGVKPDYNPDKCSGIGTSTSMCDPTS